MGLPVDIRSAAEFSSCSWQLKTFYSLNIIHNSVFVSAFIIFPFISTVILLSGAAKHRMASGRLSKSWHLCNVFQYTVLYNLLSSLSARSRCCPKHWTWAIFRHSMSTAANAVNLIRPSKVYHKSCKIDNFVYTRWTLWTCMLLHKTRGQLTQMGI